MSIVFFPFISLVPDMSVIRSDPSLLKLQLNYDNNRQSSFHRRKLYGSFWEISQAKKWLTNTTLKGDYIVNEVGCTGISNGCPTAYGWEVSFEFDEDAFLCKAACSPPALMGKTYRRDDPEITSRHKYNT